MQGMNDIVRKCWGSALDPRIPPEKKQKGQLDHSMALILACKPYHWINQFPKDIKLSPQQLKEVEVKWNKLFRRP